MILKRFRRSTLWETDEQRLAERIRAEISPRLDSIVMEHCFYIEVLRELTSEENARLNWLLAETFEPCRFGESSHLAGIVLEVGPRVEIVTPWSTNAVKVCQSCGLQSVRRLERSRRYQFNFRLDVCPDDRDLGLIGAMLYDRMTETIYDEPLSTFDVLREAEPVRVVHLIEEGIVGLERLGLSLDRRVLEYDYRYFTETARANPTDMVLTHLDQSQSDHSRHGRFNATWEIDGRGKEHSLMSIIKRTHQRHPGHTLVAFEDNASVIRGHQAVALVNSDPSGPSRIVTTSITMDTTAKGESHNHPTAIFSPAGAGTGTGGRIRDNQTVGRGASPVAGSTLYLVGNLHMQNYVLPWEKTEWQHPHQLETPLRIILGAPRGAYRYGNEFGEPTISGSTTAFEHIHANEHGVEFFGFTKCGMWSIGLGWVDRRHLKKLKPQPGLRIVQLGGDGYRIGLGGASGSSKTAGSQKAELDWNSVQRANAEMEKVVDRVIQAFIMLGDNNPICSIHDLGAGGDANALTELVYPSGGIVYLRRIPSGDSTMSPLEIWCNESQERIVLLMNSKDLPLARQIASREKCPLAVIGEVSGDGRLVVVDELAPLEAQQHERQPVNIDLRFVLGDIPRLRLEDRSIERRLRYPDLPRTVSVCEALQRVLRLLKVGSKGFLVNHVDRSVGGLVAQQQCCGPLQLPVADVAVSADGYFGNTGRCWAIGDQPVKWVVSPEASVRLAVGEALTNLVWAPVGEFEGISLLGNWGLAASEPGEGAHLYAATQALADLLDALGLSINGGKDSMSMGARVLHSGIERMVKAPGTLVVTAYASCPDVTKVVTPDIKEPGNSRLMFLDLAGGRSRIGGSALLQVYNQVGDEAPDVDDPMLLRRGFEAIQRLIDSDLVLSGHDRSDGGLITCLLEMAFSGNCGLSVQLGNIHPVTADVISLLFAEEVGVVIEYSTHNEGKIGAILEEYGLTRFCYVIGEPQPEKWIEVKFGEAVILHEDMRALREIWNETSFELEKLQCNPECAKEERKADRDPSGIRMHLGFRPSMVANRTDKDGRKPRVAILREEGTNGDREMAAAFYMAGFDTWDITMTDLAEGRIGLSEFKGIAFCGGFSYADVLDAGKGWAGVVRFNPRTSHEFASFYRRRDTFSLGVCNGCQIMALLGWVPWEGIEPKRQPRFVHNESGMFESRFVAVTVLPSPSIFLEGMAGSTLGIWVAHGEGRFTCPEDSTLQDITLRGVAPLRFVNGTAEPTESYPSNPNGSTLGIAALCSSDGRHLAMMPHPERLFLRWQWPYWPREWSDISVSPWLRLFQNARSWCDSC